MKAELKEISKNIMGTTSILLKIKGMRKAQEFIFYPVKSESIDFKIQSDTRMGKINLKGQGLMSKPHQNGAYFLHLQIDKLTPFVFCVEDWKKIKEAIKKTSHKEVGKKENGIVQADNSNAKSIFNI
jgi:hypothetical protein